MASDPNNAARHVVARGTGTLGKRPLCATHGTEMTAVFGPWWCRDCARDATDEAIHSCIHTQFCRAAVVGESCWCGAATLEEINNGR